MAMNNKPGITIHSIWDNGGASVDRYTVYYDIEDDDNTAQFKPYFAMSDNPYHPMGFGQHGQGEPGPHNGKKIKFEDLPEDCQNLVKQDMK